jgi:MFS family permease
VPIHLTLALTFFSFVGLSAARVVLTLYALELGASASLVGLLGGLLFLFPLLLSWPVGSLADRAGARGLLLFSAVCGLVALLLPGFVPSLPALFAAAALTGLALAFYHVTLQNLIGTLSHPEQRARNFSNFSLTGAVTNLAGPLLAGVSIDLAGHATACLIIALPSLLAVVLLLAWGKRLPPARREAPAAPASASATLSDREIWRMLATSGLMQLGTDLFQFYMPIYGHSIGLSASAIGTVLATFAAASFVVRLFLAWLVKQIAGEKLLAWSFCLGAIGFALIPFFESTVTLSVVAFFFGLGMGLGIPLTVILMFARSAEGRSGQTLGLRLTANNFVRVVGPVAFGAVGSALGIPPVFWINAALMGAGGLVSWSGRTAVTRDP